jgi:hypothetical protein
MIYRRADHIAQEVTILSAHAVVYGGFMMIQPSEARELCSESEWKLVESSFSPVVETLPPSDVKSRIERVRKLHRKCTDLLSRQHSDSRKRTTRRKTQLFAEAVGRFEATLNLVENAAQSVELASKNVDKKKIAEETRTRNMDALRERADRELESRKSQALSVLGVRGEQQGQKSGARHIQSHVGSVTRRQQARRDTKNR